MKPTVNSARKRLEMRISRRVRRDAVGKAKTDPSQGAVTPLTGTEGSVNWKALKEKLKQHKGASQKNKKWRFQRKNQKRGTSQNEEDVRQRKQVKMEFGLERVMALDCEMVSISKDGSKERAAARIAIVDGLGDVVLDVYAHPEAPILDYHSQYSGIRPRHLENARPLSEVRQEVRALLHGKILIGHALNNDFESLGIEHPNENIRDTSTYTPLAVKLTEEKVRHPGALKVLAKHQLHMDIQTGAHNPVEDARAALYLYRRYKEEWEARIQKALIKQDGK